MKRILFSLFVTAFAAPVMAQGNLPAIEKYKLKNGFEVIVAPWGSLPVTHLSLFVNTGKKNETPGQQYLAELCAQALQLGSERYSRIESDALEQELGGSFSINANDNFTQVSLSFANSDAERAMDLAASTLLKPKFPEQEVKQYISQQLNYNNPGRMDIGALAKMYGDFIAFGSAHPLGRHFYAAQLNKITPAQLKEFYQFNYTPRNCKLIVSGGMDKEKMKGLIEKYFGPWTAEFGEVNGSAYDTPPIAAKEVAFVNKPRATQAALRWYKKAPLAGSKDVMAFEVANNIFDDLLFDQIRGKEGKTYGINSNYDEADNNGMYTVSTQVRAEVMFATTESFDRVLKEFYEKGVTQEKVDQSKTSMKNEVLRMQSPSELAYFINPWLYKDYNKRKIYLDDLAKIDLETVNKIIKKYFNPDSYKLIIAGDDTILEKQLQQLKGLARVPLKSIEVDQ